MDGFFRLLKLRNVCSGYCPSLRRPMELPFFKFRSGLVEQKYIKQTFSPPPSSRIPSNFLFGVKLSKSNLNHESDRKKPASLWHCWYTSPLFPLRLWGEKNIKSHDMFPNPCKMPWPPVLIIQLVVSDPHFFYYYWKSWNRHIMASVFNLGPNEDRFFTALG